MPPERPLIVCLCGSMRLARGFEGERRRLTALGIIVLAPEPIDGELTPRMRESLAALHQRRIDLADEVHVLTVDGAVGAATGREIAYAREHGKRVRFVAVRAAVG